MKGREFKDEKFVEEVNISYMGQLIKMNLLFYDLWQGLMLYFYNKSF